MKIHVDGTLYEEENAKISVFDHGLLYGDGVFEGIRFYNGRVFQLEAHIDRLFDSAHSICLKPPITKTGMQQALLETVRANQLQSGYIRLLLTRGIGNLGLNPEHCRLPAVIIIADCINLYPAEIYRRGLKVITCTTRRTTSTALSPMVKSLNYLNNILAKIEASQAGAEEGLMLNEWGYVAECTADNIFIVRKQGIVTPPVTAGALAGITRSVIFDLALDLGISLKEADITRHEVFVADECFLTGTAAEIIPVAMLDGRRIGVEVPGPITQRLSSEFHQLTRRVGTVIY
ncbi:MAG: branched-chain-amino-acid transaminase [Candidatus Xiphinematobacter sp.]|nr:MAG: branched-chain-amino-acid transaminase [Candidatus Xiphinematobacter sp.]QQY08318.1 MAG: branched-chain-amino-acid transaminase [Candidatus Xiphinematobacter sp.]QQY09058.1 MAG: branched-chain-amino-acid transaminase [Candidatus Xiphinematobacter sp.]QQY10543.1 MAG: branched-chain-amino-acid transaminase [Candidatus Xiphinematobacter sp.]QQY11279.1 MAG: branched-chain-amino-acid transaminase [Candidatus Xiphinematobacter sp.]